MKVQIAILSCLFILVTWSCKKDEASEPDVSPDGEYFNCKIDGNYWTFKQGDGLFGSDALYARFEVVDRPHYEILAGSSDYPQTQFTFSIDTMDITKPDTIRLYSETENYAEVYDPFPLEDGVISSFKTINGSIGRLIFTHKTTSFVQGTFEFDATNRTTIVKVTEGKFKINL